MKIIVEEPETPQDEDEYGPYFELTQKNWDQGEIITVEKATEQQPESTTKVKFTIKDRSVMIEENCK